MELSKEKSEEIASAISKVMINEIGIKNFSININNNENGLLEIRINENTNISEGIAIYCGGKITFVKS